MDLYVDSYAYNFSMLMSSCAVEHVRMRPAGSSKKSILFGRPSSPSASALQRLASGYDFEAGQVQDQDPGLEAGSPREVARAPTHRITRDSRYCWPGRRKGTALLRSGTPEPY
jgi:hypothetical protein